MKKNFILLLAILSLSLNSFAQEAIPEQTKMENFVSKTGVITRCQHYSLPILRYNGKSGGAGSYTRIIKLSQNNDSAYFYEIGIVGGQFASIAFEDLIEITKALKVIQSKEADDIALKPFYLENKFVTDDGFVIGYRISEGSSKWYMGFRGSEMLLSKDVLEPAFTEALEKMKSLVAE